MIKIEVRIRRAAGEVMIEHEYRAELPDDATPQQIQAVGTEAMDGIDEIIDESLPEVQSSPEPVATMNWPKKPADDRR
jgi:hypothetical protein